MRVLFLTSTLPRFAGDMQANFVGEQADAWAAARPGDELFILAPGDADAPATERRGAIEVRRFAYMPRASWQRLAYPAILPNILRNRFLALQLPAFLAAQYRAARALVREKRIDLVYAHWVMPQGLVAWRIKDRMGTPFVLQNHSSDLSVFPKLGPPGRWLAQKVLQQASAFFCVNRRQREFALSLVDRGDRDALDAKCSVLPMGTVLADADPDDGAFDYDIGTIGRLSRKKGLDLLIAAAEHLARENVRPRIGIAGDGEDRSALEALPEKADISFPGFLSGARKAEFQRAARTFAFSNLAQQGDVEGMPVALLEAMALGKPTLASRDTNITMLPEWEAIRDAVEFVEDPRDIPRLAAALKRLVELSASERARRATVLREHVGRYRWDRLIHEYLAVIDRAHQRRR